MPRVNRPIPAPSRSAGRSTPRNSVNDRPSRLRMWLRRCRRHGRAMVWSALVVTTLFIGYTLVRTATPTMAGGTARPGGSVATLRENFGALTASAGLRVRRIVIEGRANTPEPVLRAAIGAQLGDPILGFSVEAARARIETLSWVEHATVERRLPDTLVVALAERRPFAIWQNHGQFAVVDRAGLVVANQEASKFDLRLIVGAGAPAAASLLLDALTERPSLDKRVSAAIRVGERRWNLRMTNGTDVMLPEGAEIAALDRLLLLQQDQAVLDRPLQAIDMRLPDKLVLRPMTEAKPDAAHSEPGHAIGPRRPT